MINPDDVARLEETLSVLEDGDAIRELREAGEAIARATASGAPTRSARSGLRERGCCGPNRRDV